MADCVTEVVYGIPVRIKKNKMKTIWNNFKVAFAMYSKIPMPPANWEKENMKYALCFFPWVGLAVGAVSAVLFWLLQQIGAGSMLRGCSADGSSGSGDGRHSPRRLSGYDGCVKFLERKTAPTGNLKRPARRSICDYYGMSVFCTVRGRSRRTCLEDFSGVCIWLRSFEIVQRSFDRVFSKCQSERNSGSVWHERREKRTAAVLVVTIFAVTALSASFCVWAALDVLVVSALVFCYYKWKSSKYFGGITGDLAGYFLSLCELAQLLSLVVLSLGMENWK